MLWNSNIQHGSVSDQVLPIWRRNVAHGKHLLQREQPGEGLHPLPQARHALRGKGSIFGWSETTIGSIFRVSAFCIWDTAKFFFNTSCANSAFLAPSCTARYSFLKGKTLILHLLKGAATWHITEDSRRKCLAPGWNRTNDPSLMSRVLYNMLPQALLTIGEPSSAKCLYWSWMKVISFCFEIFLPKIKTS